MKYNVGDLVLLSLFLNCYSLAKREKMDFYLIIGFVRDEFVCGRLWLFQDKHHVHGKLNST